MKNTKPVKLFMNRVILVALSLLLQAGWLLYLVWKLSQYYLVISAVFAILSVLMVLWIVNKRDNPAYKLIWTIVILVFPIFGVCLYLFCGRSRITRRFSEGMEKMGVEVRSELLPQENILEHLAKQNPSAARISHYINNKSGYPLYENTTSEYYSSGEAFFEALKTELLKAEHYILMEYFAIQEGVMWDSIVEILEKKVQAGVEVRVLYDDMGSVALLPYRYAEQLAAKGIKCRAFNPFIPVLSVIMNHRDHRKITVIDGHTGFTGGTNLTDQYINVIKPFGQWKDAAIMLKGEAVSSMTSMFLQMWNAIAREDADFKKFRPQRIPSSGAELCGFVQPYDDTPLDNEVVGENIYLSMINRANRYIYIYTPYLIIDNEMMTALCLAAKSGVDVRIMTPHIPDKKLVFLLTRSYYSQLLDEGVRILEYTPGFLHSKCFLCDDEMGCVGTVNLDYRSLYHHFECGVFLYHTPSLHELKRDFLETFELGTEITTEFCAGRSIGTRVVQSILRLAAPLL